MALAARDGGRVGRSIALGLLVVSVAWSVAQDVALGFPELPSLSTLVIGAGLGLAALAGVELCARRRRRPSSRRPGSSVAWAAFGIALAGLLASSLASGFVERHGHLRAEAFDAGVVSWFSSQPEFATGTEPIAFAQTKLAPLGGDRLTHPLELIGIDESCQRVRGRLRDGYVVLRDGRSFLVPTHPPFASPLRDGARVPESATACLRRAGLPRLRARRTSAQPPRQASATKPMTPCPGVVVTTG